MANTDPVRIPEGFVLEENRAPQKAAIPAGFVPEAQVPAPYSFPAAFLRSGRTYLGNVGQTIAHPIQTVTGLTQVATGAAQKLIPGRQRQESYADAVGQFILQRYGSMERALETLKDDPVGVMADASMVLSVGAGAVGKIGQVGKISSLAQAGRLGGRMARAIDPMTITMQTAGAVARSVSKPQQLAAGRMVNRLIKPSNRQFSYGRNPGLAIAQEGIVATDSTDLGFKVTQRRQQLGGQIGQALIIPPVASKRLNVSKALESITEALQKAQQAPRTNRALIRRLSNLQDDLLGVTRQADGSTTVTRDLTSLTPLEAFKFKTEIGELTKWTDNLTDDTLVNSALKKSYGVVRREIEQVVPGIKGLNSRYGNLLEAENAIRRQALAVERGTTRSGLIDMIAAATGGGLGAYYGRNPTAAVSGALLSVGLRHLVNSPLFRTGMAAFLQKSSPAEVASLFRKVPGLQSELARVGFLTGIATQRAGVNQVSPGANPALGGQYPSGVE